MSTAEGFVATAAGRRLFAKLGATARPLKFSKVVFGTGSMPEGSQTDDLFKMTALVKPFANGTSTTPVYENNKVSMVLQFRSDMNGGLENTIWLSEFGIFAEDPDGGEVLACYCNFSSCPDSVLGYNAGGNTIRDYPISIIIGAVPDVKLEFPAGAFLTSEDASELMEACLRRAVGMEVVRFAVPVSAWVAEDTGRYKYSAETAVEGVKENHHPDATLDTVSQDTVYKCGLSSRIVALEGKLKFYAQLAPEADISGTCRLWTQGVGGNGGLPVASENIVGGIRSSDSIIIDADGTAHAKLGQDSFTTDEEFDKVVLGGK